MGTDTKGMELCEALWNECEPELRRLCKYKLSSCPSEIDDVIADAYLVLCNAVDKNVDIVNPKAWLFGTVNNLIKIKYAELNTKKKKHIRFESLEQDLFYNVDFDDVKLPDETIEELMNDILDELSASERTLFIFIYDKKLKFKEIAMILNSTESAIKQKHYRLVRKIKRMARDELKKFK